MAINKKRADLSVPLASGKLNIRVAGIIRRGQTVLVSEVNGIVSLIGGRVTFGEDTAAAIKREVHEETGLTVREAVMRAVVENFYTYNEQQYHEYLFIYQVTLSGNELDTTAQDYKQQSLSWLEKKEWHQLEPQVIKQILQTETTALQHFIN